MPEGSFFLTATQTLASHAANLGYPSTMLARLSQRGLPRSEFFVIGPDAFAEFLARAGLPEVLDYQVSARDLAELERRHYVHRLLSDRLASQPFPPEFASGLEAMVHAQLPGDCALAIRPSCGGFSRPERAFTELLVGAMGIDTSHDLLKAVRACWLSVFSMPALAYRHEHGLSLRGIKLALIVQALPAAEVSGTLSTANPLADRSNEFVLAARWGVNTPDRTDPADVWLVDATTGKARGELAFKTERVVLRTGQHPVLQVQRVEDERQSIPCLQPESIQLLRKLGAQALAIVGSPVEIDFSLADSEITILEARPLAGAAGPQSGRQRQWDGTSLSESQLGPTTPLAFSLVSRFYRAAFTQLLSAFGVGAAAMARHQGLLEGVVVQLNGQLYSNPEAISGLLALLPGHAALQGWLGGRREKPAAKNVSQDALAWLRWYRRWDGNVRRAVRSFAEYERVDTASADLDGLIDALRQHEARIVASWPALAVNDLFTQSAASVMERLVIKWRLDPSGQLAHDLLATRQGPLSWALTREVMRVAIGIQGQAALADLFKNLTPVELAKALRRRPEAEFFIQFEAVVTGLERLGEPHLDPNGRELARIKLCALIKGYLEGPVFSPAKLEATRQERIRRVELTLQAALSWHPIRRMILAWLRRQAHRGRHHQGVARTMKADWYAQAREILLAIGGRLLQSGALDQLEDLNGLELTDLYGYVEGAATCSDLAGLVALRRSGWSRSGTNLPTRLFTLGAVHRANQALSTSVATAAEPPPLICGTVCVPGQVMARARVLTDPMEPQAALGEILVIPHADPRWMPLLPLAAGLVIERGSPLSHLVMLARELSLPTLLGVPDAVRAIANGEMVEIDGETGALWLDAVPVGDIPEVQRSR